MDTEQRRADDARAFRQLAPRPHAAFHKKFSDDASIHFEKLGKKTMPAGSQSPNCTLTSYTVIWLIGLPERRAQGTVRPYHFAVQIPIADDVAGQFGKLRRLLLRKNLTISKISKVFVCAQCKLHLTPAGFRLLTEASPRRKANSKFDRTTIGEWYQRLFWTSAFIRPQFPTDSSKAGGAPRCT